MEYGQNIFTAMISEDGTIYETSTGRKRQPIGIDMQKEQEYQVQIAEMQGTIDNYFEKLVELGVIQIPKTPEEIATEQLRIAQEQAEQQAQINQSLLEAINSLKTELKEMKADEHDRDSSEFGIKSNRQNSTNNRKKPTGSTKCIGTGKENTSADT